MEAVIESYNNIIVNIATPNSLGLGFIVHPHGLITTCEHIIRGNKEVVVSGKHIRKQLANVIFTDPIYDLAILSIETVDQHPEPVLIPKTVIQKGTSVVAIQAMNDDVISLVKGLITDEKFQLERQDLYAHSAAIEACAGSPLLNEMGNIIGMNSLCMNELENTQVAVPAFYIAALVDLIKSGQNNRIGTVCFECQNGNFKERASSNTCQSCGASLYYPDEVEEYDATGIASYIEEILESLGYQRKLSRQGHHQWAVDKGSAKIQIKYFEPTGLITGDAILCNLPANEELPVYKYLLSKNSEIEGLTLSLKKGRVVLSVIIFDRYLNFRTGLKLFEKLFQTADDLDNILVEEYGCSWISN